MKDICLVTYTRSGEQFTNSLKQTAQALFDKYHESFKVVICCESLLSLPEEDYDIELKEMHGTKYRRLIQLMEEDDSLYYLSIDNDITCNNIHLIAFVDSVIKNDYDIGWGRIKATKQSGFISNLVAVDKMLSHNHIRPFLWKTGYGISIPGQIFCIRGETYRGKLFDLDTFLDDLALGLYVNTNKSKKYVVSTVLGDERPNTTFCGLWNQRKRWAIGYASVLSSVSQNKNYLHRVMIHGLFYHAMWIPNYILIIVFALKLPFLALLYILGVSLFIADGDISMILYACAYQLVFPLFHLRWGWALLGEQIRERGK